MADAKQLRRLVAVSRGDAAALAVQPEYVFFRSRYARGAADESALIVLSDATIRRWCGPRWRIADSRRTRAAAALSALQAKHHGAIVKETIEPKLLSQDLIEGEEGSRRRAQLRARIAQLRAGLQRVLPAGGSVWLVVQER